MIFSMRYPLWPHDRVNHICACVHMYLIDVYDSWNNMVLAVDNAHKDKEDYKSEEISRIVMAEERDPHTIRLQQRQEITQRHHSQQEAGNR